MTEEEEIVDSGKLKKLAKIQNAILKYLDDEENQGNDFSIQKLFLKIQNEDFQTKEILHLIRSIANNHRRNPNFFSKIDQILKSIQNDIQLAFTNLELVDFFSTNNRILLFLIENKIIKVDKDIIRKLSAPNHINFFFYEIESFYSNGQLNLDEYNQENYRIYEEKRKLGENESIICEMIRNDWVEKFIAHVNRNNIKLNSTINQSNFETNEFLIDKKPTLIEYAAFYGSIQIFRYLQINNVRLTNSLWLYAIHSNNPELIHLLEENNIEPVDKAFNNFGSADKAFINFGPGNRKFNNIEQADEPYKQCIIEAIKCHHNDIANYLFNNKNQKNCYISDYMEYDNYERLIADSSFFSKKHFQLQYLYDLFVKYPHIVDLLIRESYLDVNIKIVLELFSFICFI